jgi:prepilin-type N-terminal cleavage/methylation domain-containing protein
MRDRQQGFSLIELLIAATILFMALAVATESWVSFLLASEKSAKRVSLAPAVLALPAQIDERLKDELRDRFEEAGTLLGVAYEVKAVRLRAVAQANVLGGGGPGDAPATAAALWQVDVSLEQDGTAFSRRYLTLLP